jgi:hypothetical protein
MDRLQGQGSKGQANRRENAIPDRINLRDLCEIENKITFSTQIIRRPISNTGKRKNIQV